MSNDWREHNGGPQPVDDDVWVEIDDEFEGVCADRAGKWGWEHERYRWRILNQHLIDAARLEGIRLGLEAAAATVCRAEIKAAPEAEVVEGRFAGLAEATDLIRALNPDTIAKEAQHD